MPTLTLDLEGLTFIDSSGVRAIFELTMAPGCLQVVLLDPGDVVRRVFEIVGLDQHPKIQLVNR